MQYGIYCWECWECIVSICFTVFYELIRLLCVLCIVVEFCKCARIGENIILNDTCEVHVDMDVFTLYDPNFSRARQLRVLYAY